MCALMEKLGNQVNSPRSSVQIMFDVVHALFMRELKTRFGSSKLGYFWALTEPLAQVIVLCVMYSLTGRTSVMGVDVALFLIMGILPFGIFSKFVSGVSQAVTANKALFIYRQVTPIDPFITRSLIEITLYVVSFIVLMLIMAWLGHDVLPHDPLFFLVINLLLFVFSFGVALCLCAAIQHWDETSKVASMIMRPMYFISGVFISASSIPKQYWPFFEWNPMLHFIELLRASYFKSYTTELGSLLYVAITAMFFLVIGLMLYRANKRAFAAS